MGGHRIRLFIDLGTEQLDRYEVLVARQQEVRLRTKQRMDYVLLRVVGLSVTDPAYAQLDKPTLLVEWEDGRLAMKLGDLGIEHDGNIVYVLGRKLALSPP